MKQVTIGDKPLMQISKEDILQLAIMQGCCAHLEYWNPPVLLAYIIHSGFISGYQNRYGDNLKPPTNVYHRMTA